MEIKTARWLLIPLIGLFLIGFGRPAAATHATGFNWNLVILDEQFTDFQSLSAGKIQEFLNLQPGILKNYSTGGRSAAQIIYDAAQAYRISPKVILTNIQKESSMITRTTFPSGQQYYLDWVMFYGVCDSCSPDDPNLQAYKGFANQIDLATRAFRRYLDQIADPNRGYTVSGWGPGIAKNIQCIQSDYNAGRELCTPGTTITITPVNAATAALYTYTPHPGGNFAFWYIWNSQFKFSLGRMYPNGTLLRASGSPHVWLIQNGVKRRFTNSTAFLSRYSFSRVVTVPSDHLFVYDNGLEISYANYSLLQAPNGGIYLLVDDTKRPIASRSAFQNAGFRSEEVVRAPWSILEKFPDGETITTENVYPSGRLMQNKQTGAVHYVKDGQRHAVYCREILRSQFGRRRPIPVDGALLGTFTEGTPIGFKDGELVTAGSTAYLISNGQKMPIANPQTFEAYRFSWANLIRVSEGCLWVHPLGPTLDINTEVSLAGQ